MGSQLLDWQEGNGENMISEGGPVYPIYQDMVNSPAHYNKGDIEVIDVIINYVKDPKSYCLGNVIKYVCRSGHKGHELEDWKKAQWYLERLIALEEKDEDTVPAVPREQGDS